MQAGCVCVLITHDILGFGYSKAQNVRQKPTWRAVQPPYSQQNMGNTMMFYSTKRVKRNEMLFFMYIEGKYISGALC